MNLKQNCQYLWSIVFSRLRSIWVLLIHRWTQHFSKINQEKSKIEQICIWNPHDYRILIYIISMEFLLLSLRRSSSRNIPQRRWARRNVCRSQATNFLEEGLSVGLSVGIMGIGSHISLKSWGSKPHHSMIIGFVISVLLAAILKQEKQ